MKNTLPKKYFGGSRSYAFTEQGIAMLSGAAGAIVDVATILKAKKLGLNPKEYLDNNDSYNFFNKINSLK